MTGPVSLEVAGHDVTITHPDKVVFDAHGRSGPYTKLDLVRYYLAVADGALRGVAGRPMILTFHGQYHGEATYLTASASSDLSEVSSHNSPYVGGFVFAPYGVRARKRGMGW